MSVVGFDFGTQNSRIAVVRSGGVDVICNEVSDRATPSMVSFDNKRRYAGDASRTQQVGNFRNTVTNLPRLIGRLYTEPSIAQVESKFETCRLVEKDGVLGAAVSYRGEDSEFTSTELVAMYLNKLKAITHAETKVAVSDVVISVPIFFTEKERRALIDAAEIAGLNCLRTVNDTTAAAVCYGMMKTDIPSEGGKNVLILDIGYASLKACIATFVKGQVNVLGHVFDMHLGGRDFDEVLVSHFAEHFSKKRHVDIRENKKALLRTRIACDRIKKLLSGIQTTRLELEALHDGEDFLLEATRQQLEELSAPLLDRLEKALLRLLQVSGLSADQVDSVEILGGTTRIPAIKARIAQVIGKEVSTTLNADEAVSRGCALICAIDSPSVRVREHAINDVTYFPIRISCFSAEPLGELTIPQGAVINQSFGAKISLSSSVSFPITIEAHYSEAEDLPAGIPSQLARFSLTMADGNLPQLPFALEVLAKITSSGVLEIESAQLVCDKPTESSGPQEQEQDSEASQAEETKLVDISFKPIRLNVKSETFRLPRSTIAKMKDAEIAMTLNDKLVAEINDRRNAVEEYIYESRSKLDELYASVCTNEEGDHIRNALSLAENWLYDEGSDLGKDAYVKKLEELKALMQPLQARLLEQAKLAASPKPDVNVEPSDSASTETGPQVPQMDMD